MTGIAAANLTGAQVGEYEVISRLGGGGMGVVYEGRSKDGKRDAIKTLKASFALDGELVGRFLAEARALKQLSHKALVEIFSIGQLEDGTHYYVMEFLEGKTFEDVISNGAPLDPREVMSWMCEVLEALEVVHAHGVIHRDLKPSNLFLARTGVGPQVKLIDFGVAKHTGSSQRSSHKTAVSAIVGTPDYMSPEQVNGGEVTGASDLYALGCVMFEMLTGELPFSDDSEVKKMMMHIERPAPMPSSLVASLPRDVDDIVKWMLQKDPAQRPPSAIALKRRVETVIAEMGGTGHFATQQVPVVNLPAGARPPPVTMPEVGLIEARTIVDSSPPGNEPQTVRRRPVAMPSGFKPWWVVPIAVGALLALVTLVVWRIARRHTPTPPAPTIVIPTAPVEPAEAAPTAAPDKPTTDAAPPPEPPVPPLPPKRKRPPLPPSHKHTKNNHR